MFNFDAYKMSSNINTAGSYRSFRENEVFPGDHKLT